MLDAPLQCVRARGVIAGLDEKRRRQGLFEGIGCRNADEVLSKG